jgi:hypothetical protein
MTLPEQVIGFDGAVEGTRDTSDEQSARGPGGCGVGFVQSRDDEFSFAPGRPESARKQCSLQSQPQRASPPRLLTNVV